MQVVCRTPSGSFGAPAQGSTRSTTPQYPFSKPVRQHCAELCRHSKPVLLPFTQQDGRYLANYCHLNVMHAVEQHGGRSVCGWVIWELPAYGFVEGEFHSVWETRDGQLLDITPRVDGEAEVLFLRDGRRRVERSGGLDLVYSNRPNRKLRSREPDQRAVALTPQLVEALQSLGYPSDKSMAHSQAN